MKDRVLPSAPSSTALSPYWRLSALVAILLLAAFLRLYQLDRTPPGFHYDEAFNAIQARDILRGVSRPIFVVGNFGEEPMQMYLEAGIFALAGPSPWAARLSSVVFGIALVAALYFCSRALFSERQLTALVAAFTGAIVYWAVNFSRIGIETNSLPWLVTLAAGVIALAARRRNTRLALVAGILLGASLYTYLASRVFPLVILLWLLYLLTVHRETIDWRSWFVMGLCGAAVVSPLAAFFIANPLALSGRAGQVLTLDQIGSNLLRTTGMFLFIGDSDPRDNLPGRAALDPVLGLLFLIGLAVSVARIRRPSYALLLIWLVVMALPSALTEFAPNFRRAIGALPAVCLLCAVGAESLWTTLRSPARGRLKSWFARFLPLPRQVAGTVLGLGLLYSAWSSGNAYLGEWANNSGLFYSFDAGLLKVAQSLAARPADEQLCLSPDYHDHPTVLWALDGRPFSSFDGRRVTVLPNSALPSTCAIIAREDPSSAIPRFYPGTRSAAAITDFDNRLYAQFFEIPAQASPELSPQQPLDAQLGSFARLFGYDLVREGDRLAVALYWRVLETTPQDYTVFVHLIGPVVPARDSPIWSQDDAQPGHGTYPTSRWRTGETILDNYRLEQTSNPPSAGFDLEVGMYLLSTGERLPVLINGRKAAQDRVLLRVAQ